MNEALKLFADNTQDILDRGPCCANDIVSLTIAGESLRRLVELSSTPDSPPAALVAYDAFLRVYGGDVPAELPEALASALVDLDAYAHTRILRREWETGKQLLQELDDVLATTAALVRMGRYSREWLDDLATKTTNVVSYLMPKLCELLQFAEDHELIYGNDPTFHDLYSFWEELAWLAPSRVGMPLAISSMAHRERLLEQAHKQHQERAKKRGPR